ncbi:calcium/sodium antiporter [Porticoccus sp. W117]|uniref:calcium/sodium antiporter n=1 Tax=Porticoccus sp. W117 TaxID=3054777 RepID=UPI0025916901|nr:calcium/sodium antiporter [Porticoccus sp. W117]MDM3871273.1 calcium/sodium antiporter [Porticoccus sp. W117]
MTELISSIPAWVAILLGLVGLVWGADRFVAGSAATARNLGMSPLVIGLTIVSIGTSAPEIIVAINAALSGSGELAVGNALGSNLANIGLVLGITALVAPLPTQPHLIKQEGPALLLVTLVAGILLMNNYLSRLDGVILLGLLVPLLWFTLSKKRGELSPAEVAEELEEIPTLGTAPAMGWLLLGLATLLLGSEFLVNGATRTAQALGVSELVIGLTVVAVGTSLPELATSIVSALRGHHDIALGNIFGSNLFNLLAVMSMPGLIAPLALEPQVFNRDFAAMALLTGLLLIGVIWSLRKRSGAQRSGRLGRRFGVLLVILYGAYYTLL